MLMLFHQEATFSVSLFLMNKSDSAQSIGAAAERDAHSLSDDGKVSQINPKLSPLLLLKTKTTSTKKKSNNQGSCSQ